jgi:NADH-quinone oxidoreductase subunit H
MLIQDIIMMLLTAITTTILILISVAFFTLAERKVLSSIQRRTGPNVVGFWGLLQPIADGIKALLKQPVVPQRSSLVLFLVAPIISFVLALFAWAVVPVSLTSVVVDVSLGVLYLLAISSLGVYGIIFAGWASNSRYAFLGSLRSSAQMISYEVSMGLCVLPTILLSRSLNLTDIVLAQQGAWYVFPLMPVAIIFFISSLAETNRTPFDLPEAEAELVAGYNVEYAGFTFALFFLAEYSNMLLMSALNVIFFWGGWLSPFGCSILNWVPDSFWFAIKTTFFAYFFILVRATLPRYRYDQLMDIGWKSLLPIVGSSFILCAGVI